MAPENDDHPEHDESGEAACLAHLIPQLPDLPVPIDVATILSATNGTGPIWSHRSTDLVLNLIAITPDRPIGSHVNKACDVLLVAVAGSGRVEIDTVAHEFAAGQFVVIPKGAQRSMIALSDRLAWLTCQIRRPPLRPGKGPRYRA